MRTFSDVRIALFFKRALAALCLACVPVVASAANTSFLRHTAFAALTSEDVEIQNQAAVDVLEDASPRAAKEWTNPRSSASGRVEGHGDFQSEGGLHCRKLRVSAHARGIDSQFSFPVCRAKNGDWYIASGKELSPAQ